MRVTFCQVCEPVNEVEEIVVIKKDSPARITCFWTQLHYAFCYHTHGAIPHPSRPTSPRDALETKPQWHVTANSKHKCTHLVVTELVRLQNIDDIHLDKYCDTWRIHTAQ